MKVFNSLVAPGMFYPFFLTQFTSVLLRVFVFCGVTIKVFNWLVGKVNEAHTTGGGASVSETVAFVGILDIFGERADDGLPCLFVVCLLSCNSDILRIGTCCSIVGR